MNDTPKPPEVPAGLVGARTALAIIFPDPQTRPSLRTWRKWQRQRLLPYIKVHRRVFFDVATCRAALDRDFGVKTKGGDL